MVTTHNGGARFLNLSARLEEAAAKDSQARSYAKLPPIDFTAVDLSISKSFEYALTRRGKTVLKISLVDCYKNTKTVSDCGS